MRHDTDSDWCGGPQWVVAVLGEHGIDVAEFVGLATTTWDCTPLATPRSLVTRSSSGQYRLVLSYVSNGRDVTTGCLVVNHLPDDALFGAKLSGIELLVPPSFSGGFDLSSFADEHPNLEDKAASRAIAALLLVTGLARPSGATWWAGVWNEAKPIDAMDRIGVTFESTVLARKLGCGPGRSASWESVIRGCHAVCSRE